MADFLQAQCGQEMVRRHGESVNWRKEPVNQMALYTSGGGKSYGWWDNASMLVNCLSNGHAKYCNMLQLFHVKWINLLEGGEMVESGSVVIELRE
jgi:hypothetical protein